MGMKAWLEQQFTAAQRESEATGQSVDEIMKRKLNELTRQRNQRRHGSPNGGQHNGQSFS